MFMKKRVKDLLKSGSVPLGILLATGFSTVLLVVNISFIMFISNDMQIYSTLINDTGRVRGGSQRVIKNELQHITNDANIARINQLLESIDSASQEVSLQFKDAQRFNDSLDALIHQWLRVSDEIRLYREGQIAADQLLNSSEQLWEVADRAVSGVEQAAHFDVILYYIISIISTLTVLLLLAIVMVVRALGRERQVQDINHDPLTGLYNRYYLSNWVEQKEPDKGSTKGDAPYIMLCDIDHFRSINDNYGYEMGDRVIKSVAELLKEYVPAPHMAIRLGGEAFLIVGYYPTLEDSLNRARTIKEAVGTLHVRDGLTLTISIGIAGYSPELGWDESLRQADLALYEAKHAGRNLICARSQNEYRTTP